MHAWSALFALLTFSAFASGRSIKNDLLKSVQDVLIADSVLKALQDPNHRSGAADCDLDVKRFYDALGKKELWAFRVIDSSSYFITGLLNGNFAALGNFDECLLARPPGEDNKYFPLYSLVEIQIQARKNSSKKSTNLRHSWTLPDTSKWQGRHQSQKLTRDGEEAEEYYTMASLELGMCWIRSCGAAAPGKAVASVLSLADGALQGSGYRIRVAPPRKGAENIGLPAKFTRGDWVVIILCIILVVLVLFGTALDLAMIYTRASRANPGWKVGFLAFSAYTNGRRIINVGPRAPDSLTAIGGLRVFSILWVMLGHRYRFLVDLPYMNKIAVLDELKNYGKEIILGGPLAVDTFFTIGGILNTYVFCIAMTKTRGISVIQFIIHRYIRLTPAMALIMAITATWYFHISTGPLWLRMVGLERDNCQNYWWSSLIYIANYYNPNNQCLMHGWYLMVDMQLHWFSLLILYPLWRWRKAGIYWLLFLIAVSCAIPFAITYAYGYRTPLPTEAAINPDAVDTVMQNIYFPTHARATSYLVGLLYGYYLFRARFIVQRFKLGFKTVIAGWTVSTILCLVAIFTAYPLYQFENEVSVWSSAFYVGFYRLAWSIAIGWIVIACGTGYGGPVNAFLSWTPFVVLGRLVYGIYLTHVAIQYADTGSVRSSQYYSDFSMIQAALSDFILSSCFGLILSLVMESPITALEKILLHPRMRREEKEDSPMPKPSSPPLNGIDNPALEGDGQVRRRTTPPLPHGEQREPQTNL